MLKRSSRSKHSTGFSDRIEIVSGSGAGYPIVLIVKYYSKFQLGKKRCHYFAAEYLDSKIIN
jgi:hypothetical protein